MQVASIYQRITQKICSASLLGQKHKFSVILKKKIRAYLLRDLNSYLFVFLTKMFLTYC